MTWAVGANNTMQRWPDELANASTPAAERWRFTPSQMAALSQVGVGV
jgi:hypothetical protein